jgi:nucleoside 2-deoxyribosyltransferase
MENFKLKIYLAGYSKDLEYRKETIEKYGEHFDFVDPMTISWQDVYDNVPKNVNHIWLVKRDKRLIDSCDMLVAKVEHLCKNEIQIGTLMECMYAYDKGIPIYLISSDEGIRENAWLKFHYTKAFYSITNCFWSILHEQPK